MTEIPPWGTPSPNPTGPAGAPQQAPTAGPGTGPVTGPVDRPLPAPVTGTGRYVLVIEQLTGGGDRQVWRVDPAPIDAGTSRGQARLAALEAARHFRPKHPFSPQRRRVLRIDDDNYLVVVLGVTQSFHFRVTVAEDLG